jgi:hypothetical protein
MPLWRFVPVASRNDSHWQDRRIWHGLIVRAPSAAMARILAERAEERESRGAMGNETHSYRGGFADANLYWVQRLPSEEAEKHGGEAGQMGVVDPGTYEETALSVEYGPTMVRRGRKAQDQEVAK